MNLHLKFLKMEITAVKLLVMKLPNYELSYNIIPHNEIVLDEIAKRRNFHDVIATNKSAKTISQRINLQKYNKMKYNYKRH